MLMPKRTKYRKPHKRSFKGEAKGNTYISFGNYGLQALEGAWITNNQIESARVVVNRFLKRGGKLWIRIFPHLSMTKKPIEVRMGSGKGSPEKWVAVVKKHTIMFELAEVSEEKAREAFRKASHKLPIRCQFIKKEGIISEK